MIDNKSRKNSPHNYLESDSQTEEKLIEIPNIYIYIYIYIYSGKEKFIDDLRLL